jgi:21S rRNA (GM2251-2'-O)-methyltransferase
VVETSTPQLHNIYGKGKNSDRNHQGVVLDVQPLHYIPIADPSEAITFRRVLCRCHGDQHCLSSLRTTNDAHPRRPEHDVPPIVLALDEVTDPMNMGSILRSAYCLGAAGVMVTAKNRSAAGPARPGPARCGHPASASPARLANGFE